LNGAQRDWLLEAIAPTPASTHSIESLVGDDSADRLHGVAVLFLPERDASGRPIAPVVRRIRAVHPGLVISVCTTDPAGLPLPVLARAGADDVTVLGGEGNTSGLSVWLKERLSLPVPEAAIRELTAAYGRSEAVTIAAWCLRNATRWRSVEGIGGWFGLSPRSTRRRLSAAELPKPDVLLQIGRVMHAFQLRPVGSRLGGWGAGVLGYSTAQDVSHAKAKLRATARKDSRLASLAVRVRSLWWLMPESTGT
jgi:hypothetical protein